jgi:hypothetical protein
VDTSKKSESPEEDGEDGIAYAGPSSGMADKGVDPLELDERLDAYALADRDEVGESNEKQL